MSLSDPQIASRPGTRTLLFAIIGLGAAALVTSISALNLGMDERAVGYALWGGTAANGMGAFLTAACALFMRARKDSGLWLAAGIALMMTTAGAGMRALAMSSEQAVVRPGFAEAMYAAGALLLAVVLVTWPFTRRSSVSLVMTTIEAMGSSALVVGGFWILGGPQFLAATYENGAMAPTMMREFMAFVMLLIVAMLFSLIASFHVRTFESAFPWLLLTAAMAAIILGDLAWLWKLVGSGWQPGSLADFVHISGHALAATGASFALDQPANTRSLDRKHEDKPRSPEGADPAPRAAAGR